MTKTLSLQAKRKSNVVVEFPQDAFGRLMATMPDDTMDGEIGCRSKVFIDKRPNAYLEDGIFAFFVDGIFMVKRLQFVSDGIWVIPTNKHYQSWKFENSGESELVIIGRVIGSLDIKTH